MSRFLPAVAAVALAVSAPAVAGGAPDDRGRPFSRGTLQPSLGVGGSFGGPVSVVGIGLGARYFVLGGLGPGLDVSDTILIYDAKTRAELPGIQSQTPTNIVRILPNLQWVFVRTRWFSPYVLGGTGPVFYNHGGGTVGHWLAGGGAYIGLGGPIFLELGVTFSSVFPRSDCRDAFTWTDGDATAELRGACNLTWGPRLGLTVAFGVDSDGERHKSRREPPPPAPPPTRAWEEPAEEPAPEPEPEPAPAPEPEPASEPAPPEPAPAPVPAPPEPPPPPPP
jgi:hypothetical protein